MRCIFIILDGLGDRSHKSLNYQTPLQAVYTPNLDHLASLGMNGLYHSLDQGIPMPSEMAHFLLFGYELKDFPGRGYLEALGYGLCFEENEVVLICHLGSVKIQDQKFILTQRRPVLTEGEALAFSEAIGIYEANDIKIKFIHISKGHGFLSLSGNVSCAITDSDPFYEGRPLIAIQATNDTLEARKTAMTLNQYLRWVHKRLSSHPFNLERQKKGLLPINALLTQRAGKKRTLMPFFKKWGLKALSISSGPIYWGLCQELGMEVYKVKDTNDPRQDLLERLSLAWETKKYDFIHVHTKMPDEAGHTKNPHYKKEIIEALDQAMAFVKQNIVSDAETLVVITADHSTASSGQMIHTGETVPLTMIGKYVRRDKVTAFNEIDCAQGALGLIKGKELMYLILNFMDKAKLKGLMDTPFDQPYYPGHYKPLTLNGETENG